MCVQNVSLCGFQSYEVEVGGGIKLRRQIDEVTLVCIV